MAGHGEPDGLLLTVVSDIVPIGTKKCSAGQAAIAVIVLKFSQRSGHLDEVVVIEDLCSANALF